MYHLHTLIHMSHVWLENCLTRQGNTTIIEAPFLREWMWSSGLGQCINGVSSNPVEGRNKIWQLYNLILTIYIYVWKFNQIVLDLDFWAIKFCSSLEGIWAHTIDTPQYQSLSNMSSAVDHSTTSTPLKWSFNSRSITLSHK